jgi:hypothetical protein
MSAKLILLDRTLAHYGPEAKEARDLLHGAVARILDTMWSKGGRRDSQTEGAPGGAEIVYEKIQGLSPQNNEQHALQTQALSIAVDLGKTRWLMFEQATYPTGFLQRISTSGYPIVSFLSGFILTLYAGLLLDRSEAF